VSRIYLVPYISANLLPARGSAANAAQSAFWATRVGRPEGLERYFRTCSLVASKSRQ
jgi:hypothetical protein